MQEKQEEAKRKGTERPACARVSVFLRLAGGHTCRRAISLAFLLRKVHGDADPTCLALGSVLVLREMKEMEVVLVDDVETPRAASGTRFPYLSPSPRSFLVRSSPLLLSLPECLQVRALSFLLT